MNRARLRPMLLAAGSLVSVVALAACSGGSAPKASGSASGSSAGSASAVAPVESWGYPVVVPAQAQKINDAVDAALAAAATGRRVEAAGARLVGPARELLAARITVATATGGTADVGPGVPPSRLIAPAAGAWPRWFLTAGTGPTAPTPVLRVYLSAQPRQPYGLWGQLTLLPGATLPLPQDDPAGAARLAPDAAGLVMTPSQVAVRYADLLTRGTASAYAAAFGADALRTQVDARLAADRAAIVSSGQAEVTSTHTPEPGQVYALRTTGGGALVVVALRQQYDVKVLREAVRPDPELAALAGRPAFTKSLRRTALEVLAFSVPPAGSTERVQLVAAGKADVAASGS